jgi:hypothetical protein
VQGKGVKPGKRKRNEAEIIESGSEKANRLRATDEGERPEATKNSFPSLEKGVYTDDWFLHSVTERCKNEET